MKRIQEIRTKREAHHIRRRLMATKAAEVERDVKEVQKGIDLLKAPVGACCVLLRAREEGGMINTPVRNVSRLPRNRPLLPCSIRAAAETKRKVAVRASVIKTKKQAAKMQEE